MGGSILNSEEKKWFDEFSKSLKRVSTKRDYENTINRFLNYNGSDFVDATHDEITNYIDFMIGKKMKVTSIYNQISILSSFATYIINNGLCDTYFVNHFLTVERPFIDTYIRPNRIPTIKELNQLLTAAKDKAEYYVIISLAAKLGLTDEEIYNLNIGDFIVDKNGNKFICINKKTSVRNVPLPEDIALILNKYFLDKDTVDKTSPVFLSSRGTRLSARTIRYNIIKINEKAGISDPYTLQDLRNFAAAIMLKSGADEVDVANTLGIGLRWIQRYDRAIEKLDTSPVDLSCLTIKTY